MLKKVLAITTLLISLISANAQITDNLRLVIETGFPLGVENDNFSVFLNIEPKLKVTKHNYLGVRFGVAINTHTYENKDSLKYSIDRTFDNGVLSLVPTFDYYLNENNHRPYLGLGLGLHVGPTGIDIKEFSSGEEFQVKVNNRLGALIRGGVESYRWRFGVEYNLMPVGKIRLPSGQHIGSTVTSYVGISLGILIGGVKNS